MNRLISYSLVIVVLMTFPLAAEKAALPAGSQGEVTLDWQKFHELWTTMQQMEKKIETLEKPEDAPPVPFTITKAAYKGTVGEKKTEITAIFELDVYDPKNWVKIPFLPSSVAITEAQLNGQPVGVLQEGGFHQILLKKPGRYVLRVRFAMRSPKSEETPQLTFNIQNTPMTMLALEFARPNLDVQIEPSQGVEVTSAGDKRTLVTAAIPSSSFFTVRWQKALPEEAAGPAKVYLDAQNLITVSEGTLKSHWNLNYTILRRGIRELRVLVPEEWNILSVACDGLQEWKTIESPKGPVLLLQFAYAKKGNLDVALQMERALGDKDEVLELPRLAAIDIEREQGTVGIEAKGAVELQIQNAEGMQAMDPQELPGSVWQSATQPILFAYRYTKPHALTLAVKRHPETPVLTTTVDDANAVSVITARGQLITKIRYQVRNQLKQFLGVRLPEGSELWSAFVGGESVKPTRAEDGSYRIPLAKSQLGNAGQEGFPVELIYYRRMPKFWPIGFRAITLPMPDAPVSRLWWSVYMPDNYRVPYFGGDVEKGQAATVWNGLVGGLSVSRASLADTGEVRDREKQKKGLRKDMRELALGMLSSKSAVAAADEAIARQESVAADLFQAPASAPTATGVFPVAFELPASGQLFNFAQIMVVGQDPTLTLMFLHARLLQALAGLFFAALAAALYKKRAWLLLACHVSAARLRSFRPAYR